MTYTLMKSVTDDFTVIYCVSLDGEPITNATHALPAAQQALDICKRHSLKGYRPINSLFFLDGMLGQGETS